MDGKAFSSWVTDIKTLTVEIDRLKKKIDMPQEGSPIAAMNKEFFDVSCRLQSFKRENPADSVDAAKQGLLKLLAILEDIRQRSLNCPWTQRAYHSLLAR